MVRTNEPTPPALSSHLCTKI